MNESNKYTENQKDYRLIMSEKPNISTNIFRGKRGISKRKVLDNIHKSKVLGSGAISTSRRRVLERK
jgi:hypothetical protein